MTGAFGLLATIGCAVLGLLVGALAVFLPLLYGARNLRRHTSCPAKSQHPISPEQLKNQTYVPSVTGVQEVESL